MFDIDEMADYSVILDTVLQRLNDLRQQRPELFVGDLVFTQPISDTDLVRWRYDGVFGTPF
jgi:hypothetical protein